jgi:hypothetical protein
MNNNDVSIGHIVRQANTVSEGLIIPIDKDKYRENIVEGSESLMGLYKLRT